jgi:hypothetical protein
MFTILISEIDMKATEIDSNLLKYLSILCLAFGSSAILYFPSASPLHWILVETTKSALALQSPWMAYSHSVFSFISSWLFLLTFFCLGLIAPSVLILVLSLSFLKPEWLPSDDPHLLKPLNQWLNVVLVCFLLTLTARALETVGVL